MSGVEVKEHGRLSWQRRKYERRTADPDDVYVEVRAREKERVKQGLPRLVRFLPSGRTPSK